MLVPGHPEESDTAHGSPSLSHARQPAHRAWLKQLSFAGRADINKHWLVKAEASFMNGTAGVSLLDNPDGLTEKWTLFALQTVVHF